MRQGLLYLLLVMCLAGGYARAEEAPADDNSVPLSLSAGSQISELQQRLKESERLRSELSEQLKSADAGRESTQLSQLRQDNLRLKQQLGKTESNPGFHLLSEAQQWFVVGGAVALLALLCGIFASGGRRKRRQWLN